MNLAKDVLKKVETNYEQHKEFESLLSRARVWIEAAKQTVKECSEVPSSSTHEVLQEKLDQIQVRIWYNLPKKSSLFQIIEFYLLTGIIT